MKIEINAYTIICDCGHETPLRVIGKTSGVDMCVACGKKYKWLVKGRIKDA